MSNPPPVANVVPVRCPSCGALLAMTEGENLRIQRGHLEATIDGAFRASLVCYRPKCRRVKVVTIPIRS
jgi:DNA-directed RNA polymerase subunit N (RpoN/RPB10)